MTDAALRRHELHIRVERADLDDLNHVNNAVYLRWIEDVARAHALRVGMGVDEMRRLGVVPVVRQHIIRYLGAALHGDELTVSTVITRAQGIRATRLNEVRRGEQVLVTCESEWVWINPDSGRPRVPPTALFERFGMSALHSDSTYT